MQGIGTVAIDGRRFQEFLRSRKEFLRSRKGGSRKGSRKDFAVGLHSRVNHSIQRAFQHSHPRYEAFPPVFLVPRQALQGQDVEDFSAVSLEELLPSLPFESRRALAEREILEPSAVHSLSLVLRFIVGFLKKNMTFYEDL